MNIIPNTNHNLYVLAIATISEHQVIAEVFPIIGFDIAQPSYGSFTPIFHNMPNDPSYLTSQNSLYKFSILDCYSVSISTLYSGQSLPLKEYLHSFVKSEEHFRCFSEQSTLLGLNGQVGEIVTALQELQAFELANKLNKAFS